MISAMSNGKPNGWLKKLLPKISRSINTNMTKTATAARKAAAKLSFPIALSIFTLSLPNAELSLKATANVKFEKNNPDPS